MATKRSTNHYDDITRATVPNGDGSFRPSRQQVTDAYKDPVDRPEMVMAADERALHDRVVAALTDDPTLVSSAIRVDIENDHAILSGNVAGPPMVLRAEQIVSAVEGVGAVENHLSPVLAGHQTTTSHPS